MRLPVLLLDESGSGEVWGVRTIRRGGDPRGGVNLMLTQGDGTSLPVVSGVDPPARPRQPHSSRWRTWFGCPYQSRYAFVDGRSYRVT